MTLNNLSSEIVQVDEVGRELRAREPLFHHPEFGTTRAEFEDMLSPDYWEVGASGKIYDRQFVIDTVVARYEDPAYAGVNTGSESAWKVEDFQCSKLAAGIYLATYTLTQGERISRRATLWKREGTAFRAIYHQGTVVS